MNTEFLTIFNKAKQQVDIGLVDKQIDADTLSEKRQHMSALVSSVAIFTISTFSQGLKWI